MYCVRPEINVEGIHTYIQNSQKNGSGHSQVTFAPICIHWPLFRHGPPEQAVAELVSCAH